MFKTYKAHLKNNRLEWLEPRPHLPSDESVEVHVTLLAQDALPRSTEVELRPADPGARSALAALALHYQQSSKPDAATDLFHTNPVAWQKQGRLSHGLPGRADDLD